MLIHEWLEQSVQEVSTFVQSYVRELVVLMERLISHQQPLAERWSVPQTPFTKVNFDAGFSRENRESTTGVVIRNHQGLFARDMGFRYVIIEVDSRTVIQKMPMVTADIDPK
ncbi:hypothetical protein Godav_009736 [Gossypium davidsonii]|uniref:RNase H type-1 domain-containing protein n=1 Tax=Gossypium davidsonii TaxID=34287 RepID=A0A7J8SER1_GOSDV|nr:hypothetical protein [Gossypium davidsonii]